MINWQWYLICVLAGLILGAIYFTCLWRKTEVFTSHHNSYIWLFDSIVRFGLLIICFYLLSGHVWQNWIACLIGWSSLKSLMLFKLLRQLNSTAGSRI